MNLPNALHFQIKARKVKREYLFNKMKRDLVHIFNKDALLWTMKTYTRTILKNRSTLFVWRNSKNSSVLFWANCPHATSRLRKKTKCTDNITGHIRKGVVGELEMGVGSITLRRRWTSSEAGYAMLLLCIVWFTFTPFFFFWAELVS